MILEFLENYRHIIKEGDIAEILARPTTVVYFDGKNAALFIAERPGIYTGHYFFTARGKEARDLGRAWLKTFFSEHPVVAICGFTPVENRPARIMARWLGFSSQGAIETPAGWCEFFLFTRTDFIKDS